MISHAGGVTLTSQPLEQGSVDKSEELEPVSEGANGDEGRSLRAGGKWRTGDQPPRCGSRKNVSSLRSRNEFWKWLKTSNMRSSARPVLA